VRGDVKEHYQVTIKNRFSALEYGDINRAWETIRENIKISAKEFIGHCEGKRYNSLHGLMRNIKNWLIEGSRLNYCGCRAQV
jgi:hypothetical protein